jgi:uncharacterized FAD-dependent dehydrogenase
MEYQVIIVGAGPAGIFSALTLAEEGVGQVLLLEQGKDLVQRMHSHDMLCGWGGAGAYSDGKLTLSTEVGGHLLDFLDQQSLYRILTEVDKIYSDFGAPDRVFGDFSLEVEELVHRARLADLELIPTRIRHMGTENCRAVLTRMREALTGKVDVRTDAFAKTLLTKNGMIQGVKLANGETIASRFVVAAPGRASAEWMKQQASSLGLKTKSNPVDIGVRVELPAAVLKGITDLTYEPKLIHHSKTFDEKVRTFCMNPYGEVVTERSEGIIMVNGHSYAKKRSENTNFAVLVSSTFTEPFDDPIAYGLYIARLANLLSGGALIQRLGDLLAGRRSTKPRIDRCLTRPTLKDATPGDLSFVLPYRHMMSVIEMLQAMDVLAPGVFSRHTLLYGMEVKFYSNRIEVSPQLETKVANLFAIGDGAGITRGLLQASASGAIAARAIAARIKGTPS